MALAILINNETRKFIVFALSIVAVMVSIAWHFRGERLTAFKFGGATTIILISLLASSYFYAKQKYRICIGIAVALAVLNLSFAFRSQVAIVLVSSVLSLPILAGRGRHNLGETLVRKTS